MVIIFQEISPEALEDLASKVKLESLQLQRPGCIYKFSQLMPLATYRMLRRIQMVILELPVSLT